VSALAPRIHALAGHPYVHPTNCRGDCCQHDTWTDDLATGEPWDVDYRPPMGRGVSRFLSSQRASDARPAPKASSADPMNAVPGHTTGRDGRPGTATSSPVGTADHRGVAPTSAPASSSDPSGRGAHPSSDVKGARRSPEVNHA
jgi:hypothetical protein